MSHVTWLPERSERALRSALAEVAPAFAAATIELSNRPGSGPPEFRRGSAVLDGSHVVKFAWSEPAARSVVREGGVLGALEGTGLPLPRLLLAARTPALLLYRRIEGVPLTWERACGMSPPRKRVLARSLAPLLAALHRLAGALEAAGLDLGPPEAQAGCGRLRRDLLPLLDAARATWVEDLVRHVERTLAAPAGEPVLVHGDLHGWNLVIDPARDRVVGLVDLEGAAVGDRHFDLRYLPAQEAGLALLREVAEAYEEASGRAVDLERVMAWGALTDLGDALWRTEQGVEVVGGPLPRRVDGLRLRLARAGLGW
ncbi:MAG TPA: phosphotransferase [Terriglobales bacterium]|nr:phosphotransferase [Terriglobales bacterium]